MNRAEIEQTVRSLTDGKTVRITWDYEGHVTQEFGKVWQQPDADFSADTLMFGSHPLRFLWGEVAQNILDIYVFRSITD